MGECCPGSACFFSLKLLHIPLPHTNILTSILQQNALKRDCNGKCIERIEGHYLEVVVLLYIKIWAMHVHLLSSSGESTVTIQKGDLDRGV